MAESECDPTKKEPLGAGRKLARALSGARIHHRKESPVEVRPREPRREGPGGGDGGAVEGSGT